MNILGISCFYHDAAACLVRDGIVVAAAAEERFTRRKHDQRFPVNAIGACLRQGDLVIQEVDAIAYHERPLRKLRRVVQQHARHWPVSYRTFRESLPRWFADILHIERLPQERLGASCPVSLYDHHTSHAATACLTAPFAEQPSAWLVVDAVGEDSSTSWGTWDGRELLERQSIGYPHSLGMLYSTVTALLGFAPMDGEGTVMGLAAYGEPRFLPQLRQVAHCFADGSILLDERYFAFDYANRMYSPLLERLLCPARRPDEPLTQVHRDLAASVQAFLEERLLAVARHVRERSGLPRLCLAGGVALNSVANGVLARAGIFDEIHVPAAPGDDGCAMGAALLHAHRHGESPAGRQPRTAALGVSFPRHEMVNYLNLKQVQYEEAEEPEMLGEVIAALQAFQTVGWYRGRMEFGPRALGNRSILAHPADPQAKHRLNAQVKGREDFRPFGVSILADRAGDFFEHPPASPYMSFVVPVRAEYHAQLPAIVHPDGTCRIHTVERNPADPYARLLIEFERVSGLPLLINTSLNRKGDPLVSNPREAWYLYEETGLDLLVMDQLVLRKQAAVPA